MTIAIELPLPQIAEFCDRWQIVEFALFGSVLRDDFRSDSDIDVMVEFDATVQPTFTTLDTMESQLQILFQRKVDLVTRQGIVASRNHLRRQEILSSAKTIYDSRKRSAVSSRYVTIC
jgi:uncharacterized protein